MRREIATIKNELNSLKGAQGRLEDYPPPLGNQYAEQVESPQVSVSNCCSTLHFFLKINKLTLENERHGSFSSLALMSADLPLTLLKPRNFSDVANDPRPH